MTANADEGEFWAGPAGAKWIEFETEQDHFLSEVAQVVIAKAGLRQGERVLDIGSGTGAMSLLAADAVGPSGRVLATDIAPPFVARVAKRAEALQHVDVHLGDAQTTVWPEQDFDIALSRFGVMFFSDPPAAFANIAKALRPGGRIAFAAWSRTEDNPYWAMPRRVIADMIGPQPAGQPNAPGPMGLADAEWAQDQMRQGGLADVSVETLELPLLHDGGALGAADLSLRIGPAVRPLKEVDASPDLIAAFKAETASAFGPYEVDGKARIPASIHLFTARV